MAFEHDLYYHRVYSLSQVKNINKNLNKYLKKANPEIKKGPENSRKSCEVSILVWKEVKHVLKDFIEEAYFINQKFYGTHLYPFNNNIIHNYYKTGGVYSWHTDESAYAPSYSKLTCHLNLSEKSYTGGDFQICRNTPQHIPQFNIPGVMVVFPSYILHQVTPLKKGTRVSIAALLEGPKWV